MKSFQILLLISCISFVVPNVYADEPALGVSPRVSEFLHRYCADCHAGKSASANLDLGRVIDSSQAGGSFPFAKWVTIHDRLRYGEMPPSDADQPSDVERSQTVDSLSKTLHGISAAEQAKRGRGQLRRLNRVEYEYTLRDLFALPNLEVAGMLPADAISHGFDTVGAALNLSYVQMERYLQAATAALDQAMVLGPKPPERSWRLDAPTNGRLAQVIRKGREAVPIGDAVGLLRQPNSAQAPWWWSKFAPPSDGVYRLRMKTFGFVWDRGEVLDADRPHAVTMLAVQQSTKRPLGTFDVFGSRRNATTIEFDAYLKQGDQIQFWIETLSDRTKSDRIDINDYSSPGVAVEWFEAEGPIHEQWPPASYVRLFGDLPSVAWTSESGFKEPPIPMITDGVGKRAKRVRARRNRITLYRVDSGDPTTDAKRLLRSFVARSYRRPISDDEVDVYLELVNAKLDAGECFQEAMKIGYQAVLCSPEFLFMQHGVGSLNDHAIASRLSYFLWKSLPDDALLALADAGALSDPKNLRRQVDRMLDDSRSIRFVKDFAGQWLDLHRITVTQPDDQLYPEYDGLLLESMVKETHAYLAEMLRLDLGVPHIIGSEFAMLNGRLAEHYGIPNVNGIDIHRVTLPADSPRGGLLTQASLLKVTANGTTTSPVIRGAWIVDRILGRPSPPPPPNVPAVEPDLRGTVTVRQQLDKHRNDESCAVCHRKIDPPGFALENFDVIGGWRDRYRSLGDGTETGKTTPRGRPVAYKLGLPVDASGTSSNGERFDDIKGFRKLLRGQEREIATSLVKKLLVYSTGAGIEFADRHVIEEILGKCEKSSYGIRTIIHEIVQSSAFQTK